MKQLLIVLISASLSVLLLVGCSNIESSFKKPPKRDRIDMAMSQEYLMTANPSTGEVSKMNLLQAKKRWKEELDNRSSSLEWEERGPANVAGRTRAIIYDLNDSSGQTVWAAGVSGGLWKTTKINGSNPNWHSVDDFFGSLAICAIAQNPNNPNEMYFGTGEGYFGANSNPGVGMWKSTNGGSSWTYMNSTFSSNFEFIQNIEIDGSGNIFVSTKSGLYRSDNAGSTWLRILGASKYASSDNINDILISGSTVYATVGLDERDGIYKSTDSGNSWSKLTSGLPTSNYERIELAIAPSDNDVLYALYEDAADSSCLGIYKTTNAGSSWSAVSNPAAHGMDNFARKQAWYNLSIAVHPDNPSKVIIGGIDLHTSDDGGATWQQLSSWLKNGPYQFVHPDQHNICFNPFNSNYVLVGNDGGVHLSKNITSSNPTFEEKNTGFNITQFYKAALHPSPGSNLILAGAQDNGTQRFNLSGLNNTTEVTEGDGVSCHIDLDEPDIQITSYIHNNYFVSNDGGQNFTYIQLNNYGFFANPNHYDSDKNILYASSSPGNILRWKNPENKAVSFQHIIVTALSGQKVSFLKESPNVPDRLYVGTSQGDVLYIDGADSGIFKSATTIKNSSSGFVSSIDIETGDEDHIIMSYSNYGVESIFETRNGGSSWTGVEGDLPDMPVRDIMFHPEEPTTLLAATEMGVWQTSETAYPPIKWTPENLGMANVRVDDLVYRTSDGTLAAATHGRGVFTTTLETSSVVPVDLLAFEVNYDKSKDEVILEWRVANEVNVSHYTIEKSFDGDYWDEVGQLDAEGIASVQDLEYIDSDLYVRNELYYYRLKVEDYDGSVEYSDWKSIYLYEQEDTVEPRIYPNPFSDRIIIENVSEFSKFYIKDVSGKVAISMWVSPNGEVDLSSLVDGIYFLSWSTTQGTMGTTRIIKQGNANDDEE